MPDTQCWICYPGHGCNAEAPARKMTPACHNFGGSTHADCESEECECGCHGLREEEPMPDKLTVEEVDKILWWYAEREDVEVLNRITRLCADWKVQRAALEAIADEEPDNPYRYARQALGRGEGEGHRDARYIPDSVDKYIKPPDPENPSPS